MLKAQILNQKYRVNTMLPKNPDASFDPEEAEKIGSVLRALSEMDMLVADELETAYAVCEKFSTFNRMCIKVKRTVLSLTSNVPYNVIIKSPIET